MTTFARGSTSDTPVAPRSGLQRAWVAVSTGLSAVLGLAPHLLHHAGPLAGAALFAGIGGSLLFGALGFVLAIPFLLKLRRRFGGWRVPLAVLALFATAFSISTFVIGPAITGNGDSEATPAGQEQPGSQDEDHDAHH